MLLDSWHRASMHKNQPKQESNRAILARVKKEMDEPRMAESTRERIRRQPLHAAGFGKAAVIDVAKNSGLVCAQGDTPEGEDYGKANQARSRSDIGNDVGFPQATQGAAGERLSRTQRGCAVPPGEG